MFLPISYSDFPISHIDHCNSISTHLCHVWLGLPYMHSLGTISLPCFQGLSSCYPRHVIAKRFVFCICILDVWWSHSSCPWFEGKQTNFMWLIASWRQVLLKRLSTWSSEPAIQGKTSCVSSFIFHCPHGSHRKEVWSLSLCSIVRCAKAQFRRRASAVPN